MARLTHTKRGFAYKQFKDSYGCTCSIQDSSSAEEPKIWLGMEKNSKGEPVGEVDPVSGLIVSTRMHLTRKQVCSLLPYLQRFIESGSIAPYPPKPQEDK